MTIKAAENMTSLADDEISTFKQKISNALYLYMGQMECGLRLLMDRLEGIRRAEETRSYALLENVSKDEFIRFNTEILSLIEVIKRSATTANEGLNGFIQNFGSSL